LAKENRYTFLVEPKVNKKQIKSAVEKIFNVKVIKVRTMNYQKRIRGFTKIKSTRPRFKKAIVQLQSGQTISIFE
jgi:large subunit ribosomal protein L23